MYEGIVFLNCNVESLARRQRVAQAVNMRESSSDLDLST